MPKIQFTAHYGFETKQVELYQPNGGASGWFVMVDKRYCGLLHKVGDEWRFGSNTNLLESSDIEVLVEMVGKQKDSD